MLEFVYNINNSCIDIYVEDLPSHSVGQIFEDLVDCDVFHLCFWPEIMVHRRLNWFDTTEMESIVEMMTNLQNHDWAIEDFEA